jgi:AraC-like DNA-binding protein
VAFYNLATDCTKRPTSWLLAPSVNPAALAAELGCFDQSHFIQDFKAMVGTSPAQYMRKPSSFRISKA